MQELPTSHVSIEIQPQNFLMNGSSNTRGQPDTVIPSAASLNQLNFLVNHYTVTLHGKIRGQQS